MEGKYQAAINRVGGCNTRRGIPAAESSRLTPAKELPGPEEFMHLRGPGLEDRFRTATAIGPGDTAEEQLWGRFRLFPGEEAHHTPP